MSTRHVAVVLDLLAHFLRPTEVVRLLSGRGLGRCNPYRVVGEASDEADKETQLALAVYEDSSSMALAIAGGFLGTIGGPPGILLGAGVGVLGARVIKHLGAELHERVLAPRQQARAAAAWIVAGQRSQERDDAGEARREDDFFDPRPEDGGIPAEELLDGVLLRAAEAYDQRRVPHLGALYAAIERRPDISPAYALQLLAIVDALSYRQLIVLAFFHDRAGDRELILLGGMRQEGGHWPFAQGLGPELQQLADTPGLLGIEQSNGRVVAIGKTYDGTDVESMDALGNITLTELGELLCDVLDLDRIPEADRDAILDLMSRSTWPQAG